MGKAKGRKLTRRQRKLAAINRARADGDLQAMERWAASGFMGGWVDSSGYQAEDDRGHEGESQEDDEA